MNLRQFLNTVPQAVRTAACALVVCAVLLGMVAGLSMRIAALPALGSLAGIGVGLIAGCLLAIWLLCLGYVYGDARRRAMPAALWTLIAALVPNLLGFLFYFAIRRPLPLPCGKCGQLIAAEQRFCSWCGYERPSFAPSDNRSNPAPTGLDSGAAV